MDKVLEKKRAICRIVRTILHIALAVEGYDVMLLPVVWEVMRHF
jgi:hypothetical protein